MAKKFQELLDKMTPERRARIEEGYKKLRAELPLDELREARKMTQEHLAEILNVTPASDFQARTQRGYVPQHHSEDDRGYGRRA